MQQKVHQQKKKAKKLAKRNQKLEFEKLTADKTIQEMQLKMSELNERYRDLRSKYQLKIQEKNLKIGELKNQVQRQIFGTPLAVTTGANTTQVNPAGFQAQHQTLQSHQVNVHHVASYGELSTSRPRMTPQRSSEEKDHAVSAVNVTQEDNKG